MVRHLTTIGCVAGVAFATAGPVLAHPQVCSPNRDFVLEHLERRYGEKQAGYGAALDGCLVELVVADDAPATWTILVTCDRTGTCWLAAGEGWRYAVPSEPL